MKSEFEHDKQKRSFGVAVTEGVILCSKMCQPTTYETQKVGIIQCGY